MKRPIFSLVWLLFAASALPARAGDFHGDVLPRRPRLAPPRGKIVRVDKESALQRAVRQIKDGTTILLAPGTYKLTNTLHFRDVSNVALRGHGGKARVVIVGKGMDVKAPNVPHGVMLTNVDGCLLADLEIGEVQDHPVAIQPGCKRPHLVNLRLFDAGEQFVKASSGGGPGKGVPGGIVEHCTLEYTEVGPKNGYTNGVDVHGGKGWVIRHNLFRNIRVPEGAKYKNVPSVLMWNGASETICESNVFVDCERAIAFGLNTRGGGVHDHRGGVIRNNMMVVSDKVTYADAAICVWDSPGTKVLHNTILQRGRYANAIEIRFAGSKDIVIRGNLMDAGIGLRNGGTSIESDNSEKAVVGMFRNVKIGDLHLRGRVQGVVGRLRTLKDCALDFDGEKRGKGADLGADEYSKRRRKR